MVQITLKPEVEQFVEEQVKAGHYPSADALVEAAVIYMRDSGLDEETIAAINEGSEQAERGEGMSLEECRAHFDKLAASRE